MSDTPPLPLPLPLSPLARSETICLDYTRAAQSSSMEFAATPTCPPAKPTNCCSQFPKPPPSPPRLRRTDTASNYAGESSSNTQHSGYDRWLLKDNFARLSAIEEKLQKQLSEIGLIRESLYQISRRIEIQEPAPPSSPVTRQIASPAVDSAQEFGM